MTFYSFGLNHETAPVAVREAFALDEGARRELYGLLRLSASAEVVLLSTCNRTEAILFGYPADIAAVQTALGVRAGLPWPEEHSFALTDEAAVGHVLRLASGLQSQVLGDAQILAQVKDAYRVAVEEDAVGSLLHRLMHTAFRAAKRVRTETALYEGAASISSLAVQAARRHFEETTGTGLGDRRALLLGTGEMGMAALKALAAEGTNLTVANRSRVRAEVAASLVGAEVIDWDARHDADADLVLVASGADAPIFHADRLPPRSAGSPCLVVDVAVPRNVDAAVGAVPGYTLLDLDLLGRWRDETCAARTAARPEAEAICGAELADFVAWVFNHEALQPTIQALRDTFEAIRQQEIERHAHRFESVDADELDRLTRSIMQKLLAVPVVRLKNTESDSLDFARGIRTLSRIFARPDCEDESATPGPAAPGCPVDHGREASTEEAVREDRHAR
ncbi:MAG: glutamyl-tRNA reductase [Bacteroidota bacterium]